jgi:hypothetical protein
MLIEHLEGVSGKELCEATQSELFAGILHGLTDKFAKPKKHDLGLRLSGLGKSPVVTFMNALGFSDWNPDPETQWKLALGDVVEAMIIALLRNRGVNIFKQQKLVHWKEIPGHIEGLFGDPLDPNLFEIKCTSPHFFRTARDGDALEERGYWTQVSLYMDALGVDDCRFIIMNRDTCQRKELKIEKNGELLSRAQTVIENFSPQMSPLDIWRLHAADLLPPPRFNRYKLKGSETDLPRLPMDMASWIYRHCFFILSSDFNDKKYEYVERVTTIDEFEQAFAEVQLTLEMERELNDEENSGL